MPAGGGRIALRLARDGLDVASFVSYRVSEDSDYMTGQSVMIDGGVIFQ